MRTYEQSITLIILCKLESHIFHKSKIDKGNRSISINQQSAVDFHSSESLCQVQQGLLSEVLPDTKQLLPHLL